MNTDTPPPVSPKSAALIPFYQLFLLTLLTVSSLRAQEWDRFTLPVLLIDTPDGSAIPDEPKLDVRLRVRAPQTSLPWWEVWRAPRYRYDGPAGIETRGSSSQRFPKKGYGLEIRNADGTDRAVALLGLPPDADYVLHGPYSDKTLIRNALAYTLGSRIDTYAPRIRQVELVIDNDYRGVYLLTEKLKIGDGRIGTAAAAPDAITGDYLIKIDKGTGDADEVSFRSRQPLRSAGNPAVTFRFDAPKTPTAGQRKYLENYVHAFEAALAGPNFADPEKGYADYIDLPSFIDYFLLTELARNVDGYRISTYLHKRRDGKLYMGPLWDYNIAFANADYCRADEPRGWAYAYNARCGGNNWPLPMWWHRLLEDPAFRAAVSERWRSLRRGEFSDAALLRTVGVLTAELGPAAAYNHARWSVLGKQVWPNVFVGKTYREELDYLKNWLTRRAAWMDEALEEAIN